ncbi:MULTISPECIES: hypothetical protein [unclassified Sedimentibacter]|uniref:hypothetical protein n=1 Tax=unclassified Sedimentibacter TaxID=2649220 RepID=UPI0027DEC662|nr:hypothetical protein [Sedimentibacter sp. MB35-C1]WMJ76058.1 hypothetical protein RBQ61_10510 [Sedimentibacter sp. MB35-C1]
MDLLYTRPGMDEVKTRKDIVYKGSDGAVLKFDIYYSNNSKISDIPTVALIHGSSSIKSIKDVQLFQSWGKVLAASGFNAVVFNWRPEDNPQDIKDFVNFISNNYNDLMLNINNINFLAFSSGVEIGVKNVIEINTGFINKIVVYYGKIDESIIKIMDPERLPKFLIVMGYLDDIYSPNCNDYFIKEAKNLGCEVEFNMHPEGEHGFDAFNEGEKTSKIIEDTIRFISK